MSRDGIFSRFDVDGWTILDTLELPLEPRGTVVWQRPGVAVASIGSKEIIEVDGNQIRKNNSFAHLI